MVVYIGALYGRNFSLPVVSSIGIVNQSCSETKSSVDVKKSSVHVKLKLLPSNAFIVFSSSESPGQVFLLMLHYLYERLKNVPEEEWPNFILSYDNMCNLCKLRGARANLPLPKPYDLLWQKITKVIDRLHLRNHKNELCHKLYSAEPLKAKCPDLNTMVAEQTFAWSARYKKILNAMPMRRFLFYYHRMVVRRNKYTSECHKLKKTPLFPKVRTVT